MKKFLFVASLLALVFCMSCAYADSQVQNGVHLDISSAAVALADVVCEKCDFTIGNRNEAKDGWYYATGTKHEYRVYYYGVCFECGNTSDIHSVNGYGEHVWKYSTDFHVGTTLRHHVDYVCSVCSGIMTDVYDCPGPANGGCTMLYASVEPEHACE